MPIEGFDYKGFAESMAQQAGQLVPQDMKDFEKEYIVKTLGNFTMLAGEALANDASLNLNAEQAVFITQIIAEWSFHKSVDLVHSGILPEHWDGIMQKIAFTIFEVAKQAIIRNIPQDQLLSAVEHHVVKVYKQSIEELQQKGIIDEETMKKAESQSNIDEMAQQAAEEQQKQIEAQQEEQAKQASEAQKRREEKRAQRKANRQSASNSSMASSTIPQAITKKQLKLMSLALVMKILSQDKVTTILNKFDAKDSSEIFRYMNIANLESQIDGDLVTECIREMRDFLPVKRKLTKENILLDLRDYFSQCSREKIEKIIKHERPIVKRFISQAYDGEYGELPLKVAGVVTEYIKENI